MSAKKGGGSLNGFLDRGARLEGTLSFDDVFRIDGQFKGTITAEAELVIGEGGVVEEGAVIEGPVESGPPRPEEPQRRAPPS